MSVAFRDLSTEQLDIEISRVSEGFCRFCEEVRLVPNRHHETDYGGCRCCGYQMNLRMIDYLDEEDVPCLGTTGWPDGVGGVANVGKCAHVANLPEWNDDD